MTGLRNLYSHQDKVTHQDPTRHVLDPSIPSLNVQSPLTPSGNTDLTLHRPYHPVPRHPLCFDLDIRATSPLVQHYNLRQKNIWYKIQNLTKNDLPSTVHHDVRALMLRERYRHYRKHRYQMGDLIYKGQQGDDGWTYRSRLVHSEFR